MARALRGRVLPNRGRINAIDIAALATGKTAPRRPREAGTHRTPAKKAQPNQ
jgi:hypothetical protein